MSRRRRRATRHVPGSRPYIPRRRRPHARWTGTAARQAPGRRPWRTHRPSHPTGHL